MHDIYLDRTRRGGSGFSIENSLCIIGLSISTPLLSIH